MRQTLGASHVLQGNVTEANGRLFISAELIDTRSAAPIWQNKFEGEPHDIFSLEQALAEQLAVRLEGETERGGRKPRSGRIARTTLGSL